ncbi:MAG: DNA-binding response regulator [Actinoplanes sp.]
MVARVAVSDPLPLLRRGVMAVLVEAGFAPESPDDLMAWAHVDEPRMVILTVISPEDWMLLSDLSRVREDLVVLALLDKDSVVAQVRAIAAGAAGVMPRRASPGRLRTVFEAVVQGGSILPVAVVRALGRRFIEPDVASPKPPNMQEREWLRRLAGGASVARLAEQAGYSERMMFRLLRDLYARIGVENRTAALITAKEQNWI